MTTLTQETAEKYIDSDGSYCPFCDSDNITTIDRDMPTMTVMCETCGKTWQEVYQLVGLDDFWKADDRADLLAALKAITERAEDVSQKIPVENRSEGVSQAAHVRHMASHLAQHAKIAREAITKAEA